MMKKIYIWFLGFPLWITILFFIWLIPWVLVLNLGILVYFPYKIDGKERYLRVTGPIVGLFSKRWTYQKDIPQFCKIAAVAAEDERFYEHKGIDVASIEKTIKTNQKSKKIKRGASTITQQVVKNAFLSREKSYLRKGREIAGAILLDLFMSKDSQLSWYFNIIEFGPNIYGIEDAARYYFKKESKYLTPSQCLALVSIIPSPKKWNKSLTEKNLTLFFNKRYHIILKNIQKMNLANNKDISLAREMAFWPHFHFILPPMTPLSTPQSAIQSSEFGHFNDDNIDTELNEISDENDD